MTSKQDRQETGYICGQCHLEQSYLVSEQPPNPCPSCGWTHLTRRPDDVPSEIKIRLADYGG